MYDVLGRVIFTVMVLFGAVSAGHALAGWWGAGVLFLIAGWALWTTKTWNRSSP